MDAGVTSGRSAHVVFEDGIGERLSAVGSGNEPLEVLKISNELSAVSAFEPALREQTLRLNEFRHESFARVRGIERLDARTSTVVVISERVRGVRLSELLTVVERERIPVELNAAVCLIRQLVTAVAALHEAAPDSCHGAIAPERLVITPEGKLVLVEYVLGPALEELHFSQDRYWKELGIALPHTFGLPRFDLFADVTQVGAVSLALLLGRRLTTDEYPARISDVVDQASTSVESGALEPLPVLLRAWLRSALQLEPRHSFVSGVGAKKDLEIALSHANPEAERAALRNLITKYVAVVLADRANNPVPPPAPVSLEPPAPAPLVAEVETIPDIAAPVPTPIEIPLEPPMAIPVFAELEATPPPAPIPPAIPLAADPSLKVPVAAPVPPALVPPPPAVLQAPVADPLAALLVVEPAILEPAPRIAEPAPQTRPVDKPAITPIPANQPVPASQPAAATAPMIASTLPPPVAHGHANAGAPATPWNPEGVPVKSTERQPAAEAPRPPAPVEEAHLAAARPAWMSPWVVAAAAILVVATLGFTLLRSGKSSAAPATTGTLTVGTNPDGIAVFVDGVNRGATPLNVTLPAGDHVLELVSNGERRRIPVTLAAGSQVSQYFELARQASSDSGSLQVRSDPPNARVTVDGQPYGRTPTVVNGLMPGPHRVVLESDTDKVSEEVVIEAGATAALVVPMGRQPAGTVVSSGWIAVTAPAEVQIFENQRLLGSSRTDRIMLPVGRHQLEFVNEPLGYRSQRAVEVMSGQVAAVRPDWPRGSVALNALPWAEVFVDGERLGETPIGGASLPIGVHEVVFRHPELGERKASAIVTTGAPARLSVDMRNK